MCTNQQQSMNKSNLGITSGTPSVQTMVNSQKTSKFDEAKFQKDIRQTEWFKEFKKNYKEEPDLNIKEYDYRKAWAAGIRPERDPYDNNRYHWASSLEDGTMLKSKDHPTAWKEGYMRLTGKNPDAVKATRSDYEQMLESTQSKR